MSKLVAVAALAAVVLSVDPTCMPRGMVVVEPAHVRLAPGARQQFRARLLGDPGADVLWGIVQGGGLVTGHGLYRAPGQTPRPRVATLRALAQSAPLARPVAGDASILLLSGEITGSRDCRGLLQPKLPEPYDYVALDELPDALQKVAPVYPPEAIQKGIEGTVLIGTLVCRNGRVLDTWPLHSIPELDGAAEEALRQWVFQPGTAGGQPVACWVAVPVVFTLAFTKVQVGSPAPVAAPR